MYQSKTFTLEDARALLPKLKEMIGKAQQGLSVLAVRLEADIKRYEEAEAKLANFKSVKDESDDKAETERAQKKQVGELRAIRQEFEQAVKDREQAKEEYIDYLTNAIEEIAATGVILRDLHSGLLDFPARQGKVEYFLCWCMGEDDIDYWHLVDDGFVGRRSLAVLSEYF